MGGGMRSAQRPSIGTTPSRIIISPAARKTPIATGQARPGVVAASKAAPGVDQASTTGMRSRHDKAAPATAMPRHRAVTADPV